MPVARGPIVRLGREDLDRLVELLDANGLPSEDCAALADCFHGIYDGDRLVAAGGLQPAGRAGLLRSLVVRAGYRGQGLAAELTRHLVGQARAAGYDALWLLSETAERYFERFGFRRLPRSAAPPAIARTRQFTALCPGNAVCMTLPLDRG